MEDQTPTGRRHVVTESGETDVGAPPAERQAELRAAYAANVERSAPPYAGVRIQTLGELRWILAERGWTADLDEHAVMYEMETSAPAADLRQANLRGVSLRGVLLLRADLRGANFIYADLRGAVLVDADLSTARLGRADLAGANLRFANLDAALLSRANLAAASLAYANLAGARLLGADLRGSDLRGARMDPATTLSEALLDTSTRLGDIVWNSAPLTKIDWAGIPRLGDERAGEDPNTQFGRGAGSSTRRDHEAAVRANLQLAVALRAQGLTEAADRYAYRAQVLQRHVYARQFRFGAYLFSLLLDLLMGYGYRLWRILIAYLAVIGAFAAAYTLIYAGQGQQLGALDAVVASLRAFHQRSFSGFSTPEGVVSFVEALVGLVIESTFIAMLVQRLRAGNS
jgi:uncharacterized protein YjbI with pentapeptide repeats